MQSEPLISVIIPTYNRKEMVLRAIASVLGQTYKNLELYVVDDGSSDGTGEAVAHFRNDLRFHYRFQENRGQSAARNLAISLASGELIAFLDSDNYWEKDKLQRQILFRAENDCNDILYSDCMYIDGKGNRVAGSTVKRYSGWILDKLVLSNFITNNTVLVPRYCFEELGSFDESLRIAEDYDLWLRFATRYTFLYHPEQVTFYCCDGDRLSTQEVQNIEVNCQILKRLFKQNPDKVTPLLQRKAMGKLLTWQIEARWNRGVRPSLSDIFRSISSNPFEQRVWRHLAKYLLRPGRVT